MIILWDIYNHMYVYTNTRTHNKRQCLAALKINNDVAEPILGVRPYRYATNENGTEFYPENPKPLKLKKFSCWK